VGTAVSGRTHAQLEELVGMFVGTLALRFYPCPAKTFRQFLKEVGKQIINAFENQDYPFEDLVTELLPARDRSRNPLFDAAFVLDNIDAAAGGAASAGEPGTQGRQRFVVNTGATKFDISIFAEDAGAEISFIFQYSTTLFKRETIRRYIQYFNEILTAALADPNKKLQDFVVSHDLLTAKLSADSAQFEDFGF
jgi:non-ribosomal peptide synthetase component F